jgi:hypothetical protein
VRPVWRVDRADGTTADTAMATRTAFVTEPIA